MPRFLADDGRRTGEPADQLTLDLELHPCVDREDFFVSASNEQACAAIDAWPAWPDPVLLVIGPAGSGKSHLGAIWSARASARVVSAGLRHDADLEELATSPLLVEDLDRAFFDESRLFHLLNLARESSTWLMLTARVPPEAWGIRIADLRSRLRLAPRVVIGPPDGALMRAVLVKLLVDRQLVVAANLVDYAAVRLDRSLESVRRFVAELDRRALAQKSRITRTIAADVIRSLTTTTDEEPVED